MEYGLSQGLAQDFQSENRINDLRYRQHQAEIAKAKAAASAQLLLDNTDAYKSANTWDAKLVDQAAKDGINQLAQLAKKDPNWQSNVDTLAQMKEIKNNILHNEHTIRAVASDTAFKNLQADLAEVAKNPQAHDQQAYQDLLNQKKNYEMFGNQYGEEAAKTQGIQPFIYNKPKDFVDLPKTLKELGNNITNFDVVKRGDGEGWTEPNPKDVAAAKQAAYNEHKRQIDQEFGNDPKAIDDFLTTQIKSGFKKQYWPGDTNASWKKYMDLEHLKLARAAQGTRDDALKAKIAKEQAKLTKPVSTYDELFKRPASVATEDNLVAALGRNAFYIAEGKPIDGKPAVHADLTGFPTFYDQKVVQTGKGFVAPGYKKLPLKEAEDLGIIDKSDTWLSSDEINDPYKGQASIEEGINPKTGKPEKFVKFKVNIAMNPKDKIAKMNFDRSTGGVTYANKTNANSVTQTQQAIPSASKEAWLANGWTEADIQRGVNEGKIEVK